MVRIVDCPACQIGEHQRHWRTVQAVSEGMIGGAICTCKGECLKDAGERKRRFLRFLFPAPGGESQREWRG